MKNGLMEDGQPGKLSEQDRTDSERLWRERKIRVLYSLANCAIMQKVINV